MLWIALLAPLARVASRRLAWTLVGAVALLFIALPTRADDGALATGLVEQVRALALEKLAGPDAVEKTDAGGTTDDNAVDDAKSKATAHARAPRVEVVVGALDPRLHLAPCARIEPYLPPNVRLWGRSRIGLRCKEGRTAWNVYLPIVVKVWGRGLVVRAGASMGTVLADGDLDEAEVDLAEEFTPVVVDRKLVVGRTLAQALRPGQAVRQGHLKSRQWFAAGETVKVIAAGDGFALESVGQAVTNGIEGQPARVRTEGGRIVTGVPSGERRLELTL